MKCFVSFDKKKFLPYSSSQDFEFERPVETTALFSLIGAGCIVTNQWYTTVQENVQLVNSVLAGTILFR